MPVLLTIVLSIAGLLVLLLLWIAFVPVVVLIDSDLKKFEASQRGTFLLAFHPVNKALRLKLFGISLSLTGKPEDPAVTKKPKAVKRKTVDRSYKAWRFLINGCAKSFRLKELTVDVDTGNVVLNAQLIPVAYCLSSSKVLIQTNFNGRMYLHTTVEAHLYKIIWTSIQFFLLKK